MFQATLKLGAIRDRPKIRSLEYNPANPSACSGLRARLGLQQQQLRFEDGNRKPHIEFLISSYLLPNFTPIGILDNSDYD